MQKVLRYGSLGLAATLLISACTPAMTTPPTDAPTGPLAPAAGETFSEDFAPDFPSDVQPLQTAPQAPQPPVATNDQGLVLPTGGNVSLDQLYQDLPSSIPQDEASEWLSPMPGAIPQGFGQGFPGGFGPDALGPGGYGAFPGAIPELLTYNALARCLYFRYLNFYIPYFLVGNAYYPYAYSPYYNAALRGLYAYPIFYAYNNYCYPYTFVSSRYRYGYLDWEYYWPTYRSRHHHRYDDDFRSYRRHWSPRYFQGWLESRRGDRNHDNWRERARQHRGDRYDRNDRPGNHPGNRPGGDRNDRPDYNQGNRPDRHDRNDRNDHPGRPDYQQGKRPGQNDHDRPGYNQGRRQGGEGNEHPGKNRQDRARQGGDGDDREGRSRGDGDRPDRPKNQVRQHQGEGRQVKRGGERQNARRGGEKQARNQGGRGHGRVRPAGMESPEGPETEALEGQIED
jgi:hypothetical protein